MATMTCPQCGKTGKLPTDPDVTAFKCPKCRTLIELPGHVQPARAMQKSRTIAGIFICLAGIGLIGGIGAAALTIKSAPKKPARGQIESTFTPAGQAWSPRALQQKEGEAERKAKADAERAKYQAQLAEAEAKRVAAVKKAETEQRLAEIKFNSPEEVEKRQQEAAKAKAEAYRVRLETEKLAMEQAAEKERLNRDRHEAAERAEKEKADKAAKAAAIKHQAELESKVAGKLATAKAYLADNSPAKAKKLLQEIVDSYPSTKAAKTAKEILDDLALEPVIDFEAWLLRAAGRGRQANAFLSKWLPTVRSRGPIFGIGPASRRFVPPPNVAATTKNHVWVPCVSQPQVESHAHSLRWPESRRCSLDRRTRSQRSLP